MTLRDLAEPAPDGSPPQPSADAPGAMAEPVWIETRIDTLATPPQWA